MADQDLEQQQQEFTRLLKEYNDAMLQYRKSGILSADGLDKVKTASQKLKDQSDKLTAAKKQETDVTKESYEALKKFLGEAKKVAAGFNQTAFAARDNRESMQSLNPAVNSVIGAASGLVGGITGLASAVGKSMAAMSALAGPAGIPGIVTGLGITAGATIIGDTTKQLAEGVAAFSEFSTRELDRVIREYRNFATVGATAAGGLDSLYAQSIRAGLSLGQLGSVVVQNSRNLAFSVGTTRDGAEAIAGLMQESRGFERQLRALGIGFEETGQFAAMYLQQQRITGRFENDQFRTSTRSFQEYIYQLDELSRITGMSREEAAKELDDQQRNVRFLAAQRLSLRQDPTGGIRETMQGISSTLSAVAPELAEGFQDAFGNSGTLAARQFYLATGGASNRIIEGIRSGAISQAQGMQMITDAVRQQFQTLGAEEFALRVGKMGSAFDPMLLGMMRLTNAQNATAQAVNQAGKDQLGATTQTGKTTDAMISAQNQVQKLAMEIDKLTADTVLPAATTAVKLFADVTLSVAKSVLDFARENLPGFTSNVEIPGRASGGPVVGGQPYIVGERGPELMVPGASGAITNADITSRLAAIAQGNALRSSGDGEANYGSAALVEGLQSTFMPGIGQVTQFQRGGATQTIVKNLEGEIEEYLSYAFNGIKTSAAKIGDQQFASAGYDYGDLSMQSGYQQVGGPRDYYNSIMSGINPIQDTSITNVKTGETITAGQGQDEKLMQVQEAMLGVLNQIAQSTKSGADSSKQMVRVASS